MKGVLVRKGAAGFIFFVLMGVAAIPLMSSIDRGSPPGFEQGGTTERLGYTFSFAPPMLGTIKYTDATFTKIDIPGCLTMGRRPGDPMLPVKFIQLLLPPQETVDTVTVTGSPVELRSAEWDIIGHPVYPAQSEVPTGSVTPSELVMNQEVYSSHELYPTVSSGEYQVGYSHGYAIFSMALQPVQLIPADGRLFYYPKMTVTITLQHTGSVNQFFRGTAEDEVYVKNLVSNPEATTQYTGLQRSEYPGGLCDPSQHYDYVIVTTSWNGLDHWDVGGTLTHNWDDLLAWHNAEGLTGTEVLVQDIVACPDYWNSSYNGLFNDTQAKIREFCKDAYSDWGTQYVLFGGDDHTQSLPPRLMDSNAEYGVDADIYWSNLDNSFNADHDSQWGEEGDAGFDLYSELFIGRIPCEHPQDVSNWLTKSLYYAGATDPDYLDNGGFFEGDTGWDGEHGGALIDFAAINGTDQPGLFGFLYGFATWNAVHPSNAFNLSVRWTAGYPPNPGWHYAQDATVPFRNAINNDSVTLITGLGHADNQMSLDVYDSDWKTLYHNTKPFFISDLGCHCGDFDAGNGVLDTMLFHSDTNLAFGCLYNTGYGWGSFDSTNSSDGVQTKLFWDYFFDLKNVSQSTDNWQLGKAMAFSKDTMAPTIDWGFGDWRETIQDRLLFADPAQLLRAPGIINHPPSVPTMKWSPDVGLTLSSTDPEGDNVFYMIDWGDGTTMQWFGPYPSGTEVVFNHTWSGPGDYMVRAKAKDVWNAASNWTDPLLVHIPNASLTISIHGGLGITVKITSTGDENLTNVTCGIGLSGFILVGKSTTISTDILPAMKTMTIFSLIVGLGRTTINVNTTCAEGVTAKKTASGFILGIFVLGLK